jgi:hypothetical protein
MKMKKPGYFKSLKMDTELVESLYEIPASFIFVVVQYVIINQMGNGKAVIDGIIGYLIFAFFYYLIYMLFASKTTVHILPVISFVNSLAQNNIRIFLFRIPGQVIGSLLATIINLSTVKYDIEVVQVINPPDYILTGLYTGFIALSIYLLYLFIFNWLKINIKIRHLLFTLALGLIFILVVYIKEISLFNPFGIFFQHVLTNNTLTAGLLLKGVVVHIVTPMVFIFGTYLFLAGYKNMIGTTDSWKSDN